jgi:hypothetical protein
VNLTEHAVKAWQRGFHIFPVNPIGTRCPQSGAVIDKQPHLVEPGKPYRIKWPDQATNDLSRILAIWQWSPEANIGVAAKQSGILVVDCDIAKKDYALKGTPYEYLHKQFGSLVDGTDVLKAVCEEHGGSWEELNDTFRVCTGSMGLHLYFRWPAAIQASQASIVTGLLDIRCNGGERGGYVLGAGSATEKGPYVVEHDAPVRPAPPWLVELCRDKPVPKRPASPFAQPRALGNISGLIELVRDAPDGNLNSALFWAARSACSDGVPIEKAVEELGGAYESAHGRGGIRQAELTIKSAYRNQARKEGL